MGWLTRGAAAFGLLLATGASTASPANVAGAMGNSRHAPAAVPLDCGPPMGRTHLRPPSPIVFTTRCGRYELETDGDVAWIGAHPRLDRRYEIVWPNGDALGTEEGAHLVLYRGVHVRAGST